MKHQGTYIFERQVKLKRPQRNIHNPSEPSYRSFWKTHFINPPKFRGQVVIESKTMRLRWLKPRSKLEPCQGHSCWIIDSNIHHPSKSVPRHLQGRNIAWERRKLSPIRGSMGHNFLDSLRQDQKIQLIILGLRRSIPAIGRACMSSGQNGQILLS